MGETEGLASSLLFSLQVLGNEPSVITLSYILSPRFKLKKKFYLGIGSTGH